MTLDRFVLLHALICSHIFMYKMKALPRNKQGQMVVVHAYNPII